jgi:nucleotide-binding universal stress UspA family protein
MPMDVPDRAPVPPVLVAYDGSAAAHTALSWAITEAVGSGRPLRLVHVMRWPLHELDKLRVPSSVHYGGQARQAATAMVGAAVAHCRQVAPGLDVHGDALTGETTELLTELAAGASLLVLGASGQTEHPQVLLGSSAAELTRRVTVPVAVIRDVAENDRGHGVVIGVDGSAAGDRAVREGFAIAARRRLPVVAVHAWSDLPLKALGLTHADGEVHRKDAVALLADRLNAVRRTHPGVAVDQVVVLDRPVGALLERASSAALLVVGKHGREGGAETPLGSVCHAVLHYAPCPVMIVG